jgi:ABC-type arginine transport system permease subunit
MLAILLKSSALIAIVSETVTVFSGALSDTLLRQTSQYFVHAVLTRLMFVQCTVLYMSRLNRSLCAAC